MVEIRWSHPAIDDVAEISRYISRAIIQGIFEMVEHLKKSPELGRKVPESDDPRIREIIYRKYRIIYQIYEGYLEVVRIIHGRRLFKNFL